MSRTNKIENNGIENNRTKGVALVNSSKRNRLVGNKVIKNGFLGLFLTENTAQNLLFHNIIFKNGKSAFDKGNNTWDNGYPSGGNYWGDYEGIDEFSGENQDQAGSDGIGDSPYQISGGNNLDQYPLMEKP